MTSISQQPLLPPQPQTANASQTANRAHSPAASIGGTTSTLPAAPAAATARSYANATKKSFPSSGASGIITPPGAVGGQSTQHGNVDSIPPVNGKPAIPQAAVSSMASSLAMVNGSDGTNNTSSMTDHSRKPSVTISAAGATGHMPNGGPVAGKPNGGNGIQFGFLNAGGSPAATHSVLHAQSMSSLAVNAPTNPRITSPQTSPSPIPQPAASGGRPPSGLQGQGNGLNFGSMGGEEGNVSFFSKMK